MVTDVGITHCFRFVVEERSQRLQYVGAQQLWKHKPRFEVCGLRHDIQQRCSLRAQGLAGATKVTVLTKHSGSHAGVSTHRVTPIETLGSYTVMLGAYEDSNSNLSIALQNLCGI